MRVVIDTNVLLAGLLKDSIVREVLLTKNHDFFLPEYALGEIRKHESELLKKSGYDREELKLMINYLLQNIKIIPKSKLAKEMRRAEEVMREIDVTDSSFVAAALSINADGIWSFDSDFRKQKEIKIFETRDFIERS